MADALDKAIEELGDEVAPLLNRGVEQPAMVINEAAIHKINVGQLMALCNKYKDHPVVGTFRNATRGLPADQVVFVERISLLAMIENKDIQVDIEVDDLNVGRVPVSRKKLVPRGTATPVDVTPVVSQLRSTADQEPLPE
jgi:hypothetical protein